MVIQRERFVKTNTERIKLKRVTPKQLAFSLTEVLITLIVIGVTAAITIPSQTMAHHRKVYINKFCNVIESTISGVNVCTAPAPNHIGLYNTKQVNRASVVSKITEEWQVTYPIR
jgi:prepilin-type N-terminal cleavage/methylation domain-containing protein